MAGHHLSTGGNGVQGAHFRIIPLDKDVGHNGFLPPDLSYKIAGKTKAEGSPTMNLLALKLPREPVSGFLGIRPHCE
jgi:hypothetical protein